MPRTPTADAVQDRVRELGGQIASAHQTAQQAWTKFDETRKAVVEDAAAASDPGSPAFQAAEAASKAYDQAAHDLNRLREARDKLIELAAPREPGSDGNHPSDGPAGFTVGDTLLAELREMAGRRALQSEDYKTLKQRGAFNVTGRKSVEAVLIRRAAEVLDEDTGEMLNPSRDALREAIRSGDIGRMATLVTGASQTSGGALVTPDRLPGLTVPLRTRPLRLVDLITVGDTNSDEVSYVSMTGFTNNAAETAEATAATGTSGTKPESALALAENTTSVRTVAHWIPATKRSLADAGQLRTLIEQILRLGLDLRLDQQIATGDGVGENLRGVYNTVGIGAVTRRIPATNNTLTPETVLDVIHRAITVVRLAFFEPNAIGIHPTDFESVRLQRSGKQAVANVNGGAAGTYAEGDYLMGDPITGDRVTIWGLTPVVSAAFTQGLPVVGDWTQMVLWLREGTQVLASDSHNDFFVRNLVAILAEFRAALGCLAPVAFATAAL
jgi:HK97 family phage major capsid protein